MRVKIKSGMAQKYGLDMASRTCVNIFLTDQTLVAPGLSFAIAKEMIEILDSILYIPCSCERSLSNQIIVSHPLSVQ